MLIRKSSLKILEIGRKDETSRGKQFSGADANRSHVKRGMERERESVQSAALVKRITSFL